MDLHALTFAGMAYGLTACATPSVPPVAASEDPVQHEIYLVAFADDGPGYIVLERFGPANVEVIAYDPAARVRTPVASKRFTPPSPWPERTELARLLAASPIGEIAAEQGYRFAELLDAAPPPLFDTTIALVDDVVTLRGDQTSAELLRLPDDSIDGHRWLLSADRRRLGLEVQYAPAAGPRVGALYVFEIAERIGSLWSTAGYAAHLDGDYETAKELWLRALAADPSAADVLYNLACAESLLGAPEAAMQYLGLALAAEPNPLREHARDDPDLEALWQRADFRELVHSPDRTAD